MLKQNQISICHFPTTVVLIDDNSSLIKGIKVALGDSVPFITFTEPNKALQFLNEVYQPDLIFKRCLNNIESHHSEPYQLRFDISTVSNEIYRDTRFKNISLVIADYAMPGMDGLSLCKEIKDKSLKLMLLTGEADGKTVINAFNNGLIDKYLPKSSSDLMNCILQSIKELQQSFFGYFSQVIIENLSKNGQFIKSCLNDSNFIKFFNENIISENNIVEYYLLDVNGSYLLLDQNAKPYWFIVHSEEQMKFLLEVAETNTSSSQDVIKHLRDRKKAPFFYKERELENTPEKWHNYMQPIYHVPNKSEYYYSLVSDENNYPIEKEKILSFSNYLDTL